MAKRGSATEMERLVKERSKGGPVPEHILQNLAEMRQLEDQGTAPAAVLFSKIEDYCQSMSFQHASMVARLAKMKAQKKLDLLVLANELQHVKMAITMDASQTVFLYLASDRNQYCDQRELFGSDVNAAFPRAAYDIKESGNCLADECNTAAVFHLMRVAEHGLRALAYDRRVNVPRGPLDLATWEEVIKQLEKAEQDIQGYPKTHGREAQFEFFHGAMMEFRSFKNVWRNRVMHTREDYDRDQAHSAFTHVRDFMMVLATRISEKKRTPLIWRTEP